MPLFVSHLKYYRENEEISQQELADAIGVARLTIARLEASTQQPSFAHAYRLAKFFRVPMDKLFFFADDGDRRARLSLALNRDLPRRYPSRRREAKGPTAWTSG